MAADNKQMLKLKFHPQIGNKTVEELTPWELELIFANRSSNKAFVLSSISMTIIFDGYFDDAKGTLFMLFCVSMLSFLQNPNGFTPADRMIRLSVRKIAVNRSNVRATSLL
jgi:hypothetical protein